MSESFETPRIAVRLSDEMHERRKELIPPGFEAMLIRHLLSGVLDILEKAGSKKRIAIGAILSGDISILQIIERGETK